MSLSFLVRGEQNQIACLCCSLFFFFFFPQQNFLEIRVSQLQAKNEMIQKRGTGNSIFRVKVMKCKYWPFAVRQS